MSALNVNVSIIFATCQETKRQFPRIRICDYALKFFETNM